VQKHVVRNRHLHFERACGRVRLSHEKEWHDGYRRQPDAERGDQQARLERLSSAQLGASVDQMFIFFCGRLNHSG
jgi:hypothetical protein